MAQAPSLSFYAHPELLPELSRAPTSPPTGSPLQPSLGEPRVLPGKQPDIPLLNGAVQGLSSVAELRRAGGD